MVRTENLCSGHDVIMTRLMTTAVLASVMGMMVHLEVAVSATIIYLIQVRLTCIYVVYIGDYRGCINGTGTVG